MGKRANPVVVGSFVLGGIVLAVTVIAMVGSGSFFRHKQRLIAYFDGSVNGLDVGAPVKFRGVPIGRVTGVRLRLPAQPVDDRRIPVVVEIDQDRLIELGESKAVVSDEKVAEHLVAQGLRAQLELESFITGVLFVGLEMAPGSPANFVLPRGSGYTEIPTLPTTLEEAQAKVNNVLNQLANLDVDGIGRSVIAAADGIAQEHSRPRPRRADRRVRGDDVSVVPADIRRDGPYRRPSLRRRRRPRGAPRRALGRSRRRGVA